MMDDYKKDIINTLIKRLEMIRDTSEIKRCIIEPFHIIEEFRLVDGTIIGKASQDISIEYEKMFIKKDEFDSWKEWK